MLEHQSKQGDKSTLDIGKDADIETPPNGGESPDNNNYMSFQ